MLRAVKQPVILLGGGRAHLEQRVSALVMAVAAAGVLVSMSRSGLDTSPQQDYEGGQD